MYYYMSAIIFDKWIKIYSKCFCLRLSRNCLKKKITITLDWEIHYKCMYTSLLLAN